MTDQSDDAMLQRISEAFDHTEPIPDHLGAAARDAFDWRRADAELAELLFDSANDDLVGVRGASSDRRSFRFGTDDYVIRVHLTTATMIVMVEPPLSVPCRVVGDRSVADDVTDEYGELAVDAPEFPVRVEVDLPAGTIVTPWITA
ncbi:MAG: hypothetical protein ABIP17_11785 [Ilumatobacteraceae bacterium]